MLTLENMFAIPVVDGNHAESMLIQARKEGNAPFDVVVLDLTLPGIDGIEVLRRMRARNDPTAVIVLTARQEQNIKIEGLSLGADDYMNKPFDLNELLLRIKAIARRVHHPNEVIPSVGNLSFDGSTFRVGESRLRNLQPLGFQLLEILFRNAGKTVTRAVVNEILEDRGTRTPAVDHAFSKVRLLLNEAGSTAKITTFKSVGWSLEVSPATGEGA
jgi:DNA-binding response OmpR family regulator